MFKSLQYKSHACIACRFYRSVFSVQVLAFNVQCNLKCLVFCVQCAVFCVQCAVCSVQCARHWLVECVSFLTRWETLQQCRLPLLHPLLFYCLSCSTVLQYFWLQRTGGESWAEGNTFTAPGDTGLGRWEEWGWSLNSRTGVKNDMPMNSRTRKEKEMSLT